MKTQTQPLKDTDFIFLKVKNLWTHFKTESFAFKCICMYLFVEYFRPQEIFPIIDILPWAQVFIMCSFFSLFVDKDAKFRLSGSYSIVLLFFVVINFSILVAFNQSWALENYISIAQWVVIIFLITTIVSTKERFYIFFLLFFLCCAKIAFGTARNWAMRGFSFTSWGLMGPSGYFQNSGELAVLMLILFPLAFYFYMAVRHDVSKWEKLILLITVISPILTILGSSSRGAQLALLLQLLIMFYKKIFSPKFLIGISIVGVIGFQLLPEEQKDRYTTIGEDKTSMQRQLYWKNGWEMMKEHPALGVGFFNFQPYFQTYYPEDILYKRAQLPHNIFIQVGTDAGFTGLLLFVFIIISTLIKRYPMKVSQHTKDHLYLYNIWKGLKIGIIGFVVAGQFVTIAYYPFLWIGFALQQSLKNSVLKSQVNNET